MKVFARTDVGKVRPINEDSYYAPRVGERFCAIADGMGGHNAGEVASALAVKTFAEIMRDSLAIHSPSMQRAGEIANHAVFRESTRVTECSGMGTTFTALGQSDGNMYIAHVGDRRAYLIRTGAIMRLTIDHTLVEEMVLQGLITPRAAKYHPKRNIITRALGTSEYVEVDLIQIELMRGDVFFLCTDGLSNCVEEKRILEIAKGEGSWEEKIGLAVDAALAGGGSDNITAMLVTFEEARQ